MARAVDLRSPTEVIVRTALLCAALAIATASILVDRRIALSRNAQIAAGANSVGRIASRYATGLDDLIDDVFDAATAAPERYFDEAIGLFCSLLVDEAYRTRIIERVSLEGDKARKTTRIDYLISSVEKNSVVLRAASARTGPDLAGSGGSGTDDATPPRGTMVAEPSADEAATIIADAGPIAPPISESATLLVPLLLVKKGSLLSSLEIRGHDGARLTELSQRETRGLAAIALSSYFNLAFSGIYATGNDSPQQQEVLYSADADTCLWKIRQLALRPEPIPRPQANQEFNEAVRPLLHHVADTESLAKLRKLCLSFADSYFMAAEVPVPVGYFISVEIETVFSMFEPPISWQRKIRSFFGMKPTRYSMELDMAHHTKNYHAEFEAPGSPLYVHRHYVMDQDDEQEIDRHYFTQERKGLVIYNSDPDRVAPRVNLRDFTGPNRPHLTWEIHVEEVPPGTLAPILSLSIAATVLSFCFAFITPGVASPEFDAPALVVALPLFVVTFFGFSFEKMSRSSLAGVFFFIASSILIVTCAILVLLSSSRALGTVHEPSLLGFWRIASFNWMLMTCSLLQLVISLTLAFLVYRRVQRYRAVTNHGYSEGALASRGSGS